MWEGELAAILTRGEDMVADGGFCWLDRRELLAVVIVVVEIVVVVVVII